MQINLEAKVFKLALIIGDGTGKKIKQSKLMKMDLGSGLSSQFTKSVSLISEDKLTL